MGSGIHVQSIPNAEAPEWAPCPTQASMSTSNSIGPKKEHRHIRKTISVDMTVPQVCNSHCEMDEPRVFSDLDLDPAIDNGADRRV